MTFLLTALPHARTSLDSILVAFRAFTFMMMNPNLVVSANEIRGHQDISCYRSLQHQIPILWSIKCCFSIECFYGLEHSSSFSLNVLWDEKHDDEYLSANRMNIRIRDVAGGMGT